MMTEYFNGEWLTRPGFTNNSVPIGSKVTKAVTHEAQTKKSLKESEFENVASNTRLAFVSKMDLIGRRLRD